jgi:hypothetical protein
MSNLAKLEDYCAYVFDCSAVVNAAEWLSQPDEEETPVLEKMFDAGDRVAIVAQSKARKSFFALQFAICAATGSPFLGMNVTQQKVLLCNGEIKRSKYKARIKKVLDGLKLPPEILTNMEVLNLREIIGNDATLDSLLATCKQRGITLCVIDPMYLFVGDEIDQQEVKDRLAELKKFSAEGITTVSVYHATKGLIGDKQVIDRIAGSGVFARDADAIITLALHENKTDVVVSCALRNYVQPENRTISFVDGVFIGSDLAATEFSSRSKPKREFDLEKVAKCVVGEMTYEETCSAIGASMEVGVNTAKGLVTQCTLKGFLSKRASGRTKFYTCTIDPDTTSAKREIYSM